MTPSEHEQAIPKGAIEEARRLALESDLVARSQRGDREAFDALVEMAHRAGRG